ncbi:glycosyltransferase family 2 protein [Arthrobacter sp. KR32]|uniref:Glycosyltransferase family 2 protein n=1 Tax=Arthrobacter bussei TaxID=2594179 RepID=A0A7X1NRB9_9MICC|nr:glycosyltransferase family 2 protein [Arthrobacter bussei]
MGRSLGARAPQVAEASGLIRHNLRVTAVVVAHNGAEYLPETLEALERQSRPADFCVGVDAGSTDRSASILQLDLPVGSPVVGAPARAGFGIAVRSAVAEIPSRPSGVEADDDWLWLLHDDAAPEPDALAEMLLAVERAPSVTVAGAKQVAWDDRRELVDVGLSISRWAERLTLIDVDEHDQGQYDARSDVFAVNSAGMLVRRDVWDELGGFDPALHGVGDDIDLCWRNRVAGHRVVVVPSATVRHVVARPHPVSTPRAARSAEVYLRLKHARLWAVPFLAVGAVLGGSGRFLLSLVAKDPAHGAGQLLGSLAGVSRPVNLFRSRRSVSRTRRRPRSIVRPLITARRDVWSHRRSVLDAFTSRGSAGQQGPQHVEEYVPSGDSNDDFAALAAPARLWVGLGAVAAVVLLLATAFVGLHSLIGAPALAGGALLPVAATPGAVWDSATSWWTALGTGLAAHASPFAFVLWLLSLLGLGSANAAVVVLVVCALPLAGLSAWFAAGGLTKSRGLRLWAALLWGAAPTLQVALGSGRLGSLIAHILLPLALLGAVRAVGAALGSRPVPDGVSAPGTGGVRSWTAGAATGLLLALVTASAPSLLPFVAVGLASALLIGRRRTRTLWWALLPVVALHLPYVLSAIGDPRGLLGDPGVPRPFEAAAPWQQLLGFPVAFDPMLPLAGADLLGDGPWALVAAVVIGAPVVLLAAAALFLPGGRGTAVRWFWGLAVLAFALAVASSALPVAAGATSLIGIFPGPLVSVLVLCLLAAALSGLPGRTDDVVRPRQEPARRRLAIVAGGLALAVGPALSLALWLAPELAGPPAGVVEPVVIPGSPTEAAPLPGPGTTAFGTALGLEPAAGRPLPATAADRGTGADRTRTLVITVDDDDTVGASLMRGAGTTLDALNPLYAARDLQGGNPVAVREDSASTRILRTSVAVIVGATGADPRDDLRDLGVGFVVLQQSDTAGDFLSARIDSVPGLTAVGDTDSGRLWRVTPATLEDGTEDAGGSTARVRVLAADGLTLTAVPSGPVQAEGVISPGPAGRTLAIAEEADPGWQATLDGRPLDRVSDGWRQSFALPAEGGNLRVTFASPYQPWSEAVQAVVIGLTLLLAIPLPTRQPVTKTRSGRGALRTPVRPPVVGRSGSRPAERDGRTSHPQTVGDGTGRDDDRAQPVTSGSGSV